MPRVAVSASPAAGAVNGAPLNIVLTADSAASNNSTVLTNDATLFWTIGANDIWFAEAFLIISAASATADFKCQFTGPAGFTGYFGAVGLPNTNGAAFAPTTSGNTPIVLSAPNAALAFGVASGNVGTSIAASIIGGGTGGTVNFQWSQNTATVENVLLKKGSWMRCTRLA